MPPVTSTVTASGPTPAPVSTGRRRLGQIALVVGGLALFVASIAGYANRRLLDSDRFGDAVEDIVRRPAVNEALAHELTAQVLDVRPDLIAVAPLVESISRALLASPLVTGPVRVAAGQFHRAFTTPHSGQLVLRLADLGAVVVSVLGQLRAPPVAAADAPTDPAPPSTTASALAAALTAESVAVTLANIGSQGFADDTIRLARFLEVLVVVASVAAVAGFGVALWAAADRRRALGRVAGAILAVAAVLAVLLVVVGVLARTIDESSLSGAVLAATWYVLVRPMWWTVGVLGLAAGMLLLGVRFASTPGGVRESLAAFGRAATRPAATTRRAAVARAVGLVVLGAPPDRRSRGRPHGRRGDRRRGAGGGGRGGAGRTARGGAGGPASPPRRGGRGPPDRCSDVLPGGRFGGYPGSVGTPRPRRCGRRVGAARLGRLAGRRRRRGRRCGAAGRSGR